MRFALLISVNTAGYLESLDLRRRGALPIGVYKGHIDLLHSSFSMVARLGASFGAEERALSVAPLARLSSDQTIFRHRLWAVASCKAFHTRNAAASCQASADPKARRAVLATPWSAPRHIPKYCLVSSRA